MKYAILGGTFNPVHIGHLFLADSVLSAFAYDRVILVPAFQSPLKECAGGASPRDRAEMLAASIAGDPRLTIDDCELKREGLSYTIDTLMDIIARYEPEGKPGLILGDDLASSFYKWHDPEKIAELADIIVARRLSNTAGGGPSSGTENAEFPYPHKKLDNEIINIASNQVREKISRGDAWRYLVPSGARHIIEDRGLYGHSGFSEAEAGGGPQKDNLSRIIVNVENDVRSGLEFAKFIHSRNTALLSWDLCRRFDLDVRKGYLAGIAHDMCKPLGDKELIRLAHADGGNFSKLEMKKPSLLHGRAAAVLLHRRYGINDKDILEAIKYHTTGIRDMNPIAKVVYIADKIEITRNGVDPAFRKISENCDLDVMFAAVVSNTVSYLKSRQLDISYGTRRLLSAMNKRTKL